MPTKRDRTAYRRNYYLNVTKPKRQAQPSTIEQRPCGCGCGEIVEGRKRYVNGTHRQRAWRQNAKGTA